MFRFRSGVGNLSVSLGCAGEPDVVHLVGNGVLERGLRRLGVEVKEDSRFSVSLKNETVRLRLDDGVHAGSNRRVRWQVR